MQVKDFMQRQVVTLGLEDSLDVAEDIMTLEECAIYPSLLGNLGSSV